MSKRPAPPKSSPPAEQVQITDEWGIYDPAKAGMPALFKRLGRPVLRASPGSARRERRRAQRPERTTEGVGLAIAEARKRAGLVPGDMEHPLVGGNPARAMRLALKAHAAATPSTDAPFVAPPVEPRPVAVVETAPPPAPFKKRGGRKALASPDAAVNADVKRAVTVAAAVEHGTESTPPRQASAAMKARGRRLSAKPRPRVADVASPAAPPVAAVESSAITTAPPAPPPTAARPEPAAPPAPLPGRPRGPVPLAAWARAVVDAPKPEPRRSDTRGFWRGVFRIPMEVALVEYARGCRIHRLLVEAGDDHVPDFI